MLFAVQRYLSHSSHRIIFTGSFVYVAFTDINPTAHRQEKRTAMAR